MNKPFNQANPLAMIIEDDDKLSVIFDQALIMSGYKTMPIRDGQAAIDALAETRPALIVLDLHLPKISGDVILQHIRQDEALQDCLVIVATADPSMADSLQGQADFVFIKPISFSQLKEMATRLRQTLG